MLEKNNSTNLLLLRIRDSMGAEGLSAEGGGTHIRLSTLELEPVLRIASFSFMKRGRVRRPCLGMRER